VAFDPGTKLIFSTNGEVTVATNKEENPYKYSEVQTLETQPGGRTLALDSKTHNLL